MTSELASLGKRIATLRMQRGWTQERLAERLAVSRVAVSHIEMGLSVPSERTVVLLAGIFQCEPHQLVADTNYPTAKRERLPAVASRYTQVELLTLLLHHDIAWIESGARRPGLFDAWQQRLHDAMRECSDAYELTMLRELEVLLMQKIPRM